MRITQQDLASPPRPTTHPRRNALRPRRWSLLATSAMIGILLIVVFAFGVLAAQRAQNGVAPLAAENPRLELASIWQQSNLPMLYLDVEFKDVQQLKADRQSAQVAGVHVARPGEAVTATARLGNDNIPVQIQLPAGPYNSDAWAFEITTQGERSALGWHHLMLYEAASHQALSQWGLSESLRREGILSAPVQPIQVTLNGDVLGVYSAWPAPEEVAAQNHLSSALVYFDQTLYWQDLLRQRRSGPIPTSINLSDCQVATAAAVSATQSAEQIGTARGRLRDLQTGARKPSDVLDVMQMGTLLALGSLWQGAPLDDWSGLMFYLDSSTDRLRPVVGANLISAPGEGTLRWPACFDDPILQAAYVRAVERISQSDYGDQLRAALGNFDQMQSAFSARDGTLRAQLTWDELAARQRQLARWLEPTQTVLASWALPPTASLTPSSTLSVSLSNLQRVPVEILGFDVGKSTFLPIDPAWIQDGADLVVSSSKGSVVLRASGEGRLRALRLNVPYTAVFAAGRAYGETVEMQIVTRIWGLARQQSTPMQQIGGQ